MATEKEVHDAVARALKERDIAEAGSEAAANAVALGLVAGILFPPIGIATVATAVGATLWKGSSKYMKTLRQVQEENPELTPEEAKKVALELCK